jgi:hypothetical protein
MKAISHFLRTTILGGALFLMPIVVLTFLLNKAFDFARRELKQSRSSSPINWFRKRQRRRRWRSPSSSSSAFCLLGRTVLTQKIMSRLESAMLSNVPAYGYLKQAGSSMKGLGEIAEPRGARANRGAWRLGVRRIWWGAALPRFSFLTRPTRFRALFFFLASDKVRPLDLPLASTLRCLEQCGKWRVACRL